MAGKPQGSTGGYTTSAASFLKHVLFFLKYVLTILVVTASTGEDKGEKYWVIRNSWGADWGENGYMRLLRHDGDEAKGGRFLRIMVFVLEGNEHSEYSELQP